MRGETSAARYGVSEVGFARLAAGWQRGRQRHRRATDGTRRANARITPV